MNTNHYPSLELCKKLTEIGFPETEKVFAKLVQFKKEDPEHEISDRFQDMLWECVWDYVCPSVMEMLDIMPIEIKKDDVWYMLVVWGNWCVQYYPDNFNYFHIPLADFRWNIPNTLAEMILWLHSNWYLKF